MENNMKYILLCYEHNESGVIPSTFPVEKKNIDFSDALPTCKLHPKAVMQIIQMREEVVYDDSYLECNCETEEANFFCNQCRYVCKMHENFHYGDCEEEAEKLGGC